MGGVGRCLRIVLARLGVVVAGFLAAASSATACAQNGWGYAAVVGRIPSHGVAATLEAESRPAVESGHVAAWVGVGGRGLGAGGSDAWIQVGVAAFPGAARVSLYQEVSQDLAKLQRSLFEESWRDSLEDIKLVCPGLLAEKGCAALAANWQTLSIGTDGATDGKNRPDASANVLVYKRGQSADRWAEKFTNTALKPLQGSAGYAKLKPVAEDMSSKMYLGYPDAKLFHMRKVFVPKQRASTEAVKVTQRPVACSAWCASSA